MEKSKRTKALSIVLIVSLLVTLFVGPARATEDITNSFTVTVGSVEAVPGETVDVTVDLSEVNGGYRALDFAITYDGPITLTGVKCEKETTYTGEQGADVESLIVTTSKELTDTPYVMQWAYVTGSNVTYYGKIATLTFKVADDATAGTVANVKIAAYNESGSLDVDGKPVAVKYVNGTVTVEEEEEVITTQVVQKGRNLEYKDMIYVIDIFQLVDAEGIDLTTDAGLLSWSVDEYEAEGFEIAFDEEHATVGLEVYPDSPDKNNPFYYGRSEGIFTRALSEQRYYAGYVKLPNGKFVYSEARLYGPRDYAYNMIGKTSTSTVTKNLCIALLNYISAAQKYFNKNIADELLVNNDLTEAQKNIDWDAISADINLADTVPEGISVDRDKVIFKGLGRNLLFEEMISLVTAYVTTNNSDILNAQECGTIFWTSADQLTAIEGTPSIDNFGQGEKVVGFDVYMNTAGQWYSSAPAVAPKNMADTEYFYMGYVVKADGTVSYSGISSYGFEQYIYNTVTNTNSAPEMVEFAKRLFVYERAAKAAIK